MPYAASIYARALREAAVEAPAKETPGLIDRWLDLIASHGARKRLDAIVVEVERQADEAAGRLRATVTSARRLDDASLETLAKMLRSRTGVKEIVWQKVVDETLLGGAVIRYEDNVIDVSLAQTVSELSNAIKR